MRTPDLVLRGRRLTGDRALVMASVETGGDEARDAVHLAGKDGADLVEVPAGALPHCHPGPTFAVATGSAEVAEAACRAGARLIRDTGDADPALLEIVARHGAGYVCAAPGGAVPIAEALAERAERAAAAGVPRQGILVDPGAERPGLLAAVLRQLDAVAATGWPVLLTAPGETAEALTATALAARHGVAVFRTTRVRQTRHAAEMVASVLGTRPPAKAVRWE
ncbi:dihydropteroate synthase [Amycolatopsis samaneae]|uniref:Dihydropteroate synthase n=1 Tax=Amycolatopsis samaneae TaxID=664691 RepID=A0ABW5GLM3_9PSEU